MVFIAKQSLKAMGCYNCLVHRRRIAFPCIQITIANQPQHWHAVHRNAVRSSLKNKYHVCQELRVQFDKVTFRKILRQPKFEDVFHQLNILHSLLFESHGERSSEQTAVWQRRRRARGKRKKCYAIETAATRTHKDAPSRSPLGAQTQSCSMGERFY